VVGKLLKVKFFFQVETRQRAALFFVGLLLPASVYLNFQVRVRERGVL
jgi:hypothetical protein